MVVASGSFSISSSSVFCFSAYTVKADDCGVYTVDVGVKNHNYGVKEVTTPASEFASVGVLAAILLSALAFVYLMIRNRT